MTQSTALVNLRANGVASHFEPLIGYCLIYGIEQPERLRLLLG